MQNNRLKLGNVRISMFTYLHEKQISVSLMEENSRKYFLLQCVSGFVHTVHLLVVVNAKKSHAKQSNNHFNVLRVRILSL